MKRNMILLAAVLTFSLTALSISSLQRAKADQIPKEVTQLIEDRNSTYTLAKDYYSVHEKGFSVHYIKETDKDESYSDLSDLFYKQDHWLFILEKSGSSEGTILIGKEYSKYQVLAWGEPGEMFYHTLALADPSGEKDVTVLHYAGHYYLMKNDQLFQVPRTKLEYERNPYAMDTPMESKDFLKLVLNNKN
ncbi:MAG TPA: hypothetical protein DEF30_07355 [Proteiniclasticum sp.]|uniref:hypothetical protein n=1 Tax=Proteiniclasticum sp. TaxID=2053595 RepID=UPI000E82FCDD|nr:hypothetical protein [Proteiniclasticum sp.]HBW13616.1 hypothetical protein [Proteiniclasticum sp.]